MGSGACDIVRCCGLDGVCGWGVAFGDANGRLYTGRGDSLGKSVTLRLLRQTLPDTPCSVVDQRWD